MNVHSKGFVEKFVIRISTNDSGKVSLELVFLSSAEPVTATRQHLLLLRSESPQALCFSPVPRHTYCIFLFRNQPRLIATHLLCSAGRSAIYTQKSCRSFKTPTQTLPNSICPRYKLVCQLVCLWVGDGEGRDQGKKLHLSEILTKVISLHISK